MSETLPEDVPDPVIGAVLGSYRITAALSAGGMGAVYRAQHELLGRPAAVKLLRPELTSDEDLVQRFFNEARAATAIRHPGIVEVYDFGYTTEGKAYLVMEFLEGAPLGKRIAEHGRFSERDAAWICRGIASALKAAHGKGIVHRDLKPDNIFLVPDSDSPTGDRVKVLDFGIAKLQDGSLGDVRRTQTGMLIGTPLYMAPEQARAAGAIDQRADLYSLGCILYELLVGAPPFVAQGAGEIIAMQMFSQPESPRARVPSLSADMEAIVMKLLAKEPHERFQTAKEVSDALGAAAGLSPAASTPMPRASASVAASATARTEIARPSLITDEPPPARSRSALPVIAGVLTLGVAAAIIAIVMARDSRPSRATAPAPAEPVNTVAPAATVAPAPTPVADTVPPPAMPVVETAPAKTQPAPRPKRPKVTPYKPDPPTPPKKSPYYDDL